MSDNSNLVVEACKKAWKESWIPGTPNIDNCSGFVKSVAHELGVPLGNNNADGIAEEIGKKWKAVADGKTAESFARDGKLVLAALKAASHKPKKTSGHVVVIVPGTLYRNKYPVCWGGSTGQAQSEGKKSVGEVWNTTDRDAVKYYYYEKPAVSK